MSPHLSNRLLRCTIGGSFLWSLHWKVALYLTFFMTLRKQERWDLPPLSLKFFFSWATSNKIKLWANEIDFGWFTMLLRDYGFLIYNNYGKWDSRMLKYISYTILRRIPNFFFQMMLFYLRLTFYIIRLLFIKNPL